MRKRGEKQRQYCYLSSHKPLAIKSVPLHKKLIFVCLFVFTVKTGHCHPNPCLNQGTCSEGLDGTYDCQCVPGYCGPHCKGTGYTVSYWCVPIEGFFKT